MGGRTTTQYVETKRSQDGGSCVTTASTTSNNIAVALCGDDIVLGYVHLCVYKCSDVTRNYLDKQDGG
jgi:hypothetical protein